MSAGSHQHHLFYERDGLTVDWTAWAYSVIACALACSIVSQIGTSSKRKEILRLLCGIVLAISILYPFTRVNPEDLLQFSQWDPAGAEAYIAEGEKIAAQARMDSIKASCETYILDRAKDLEADIRVDISLDDEGIPVFAELHGEPDADVQSRLQTIITAELGIPKENQKWIWKQENNSS